MKIRNLVFCICCLLSAAAWSSGSVQLTDEDQKKIDEMAMTLSVSEPLPLSQIPDQVIELVGSRDLGFQIQSAEKALETGDTYVRLVGVGESGGSLKFYIRYEGSDVWAITEIQRELPMSEVPRVVKNLLSETETSFPKRIVEHEKEGGIVVYQFFSNEKDDERVTEIKLSAELVGQE